MLTEYRNQIDRIDDQLVELLAQRFEVVRHVGIHKKELGLPALQPGRWQEVLEKRMKTADSYGISRKFITDIWNRIHAYALEIEETESITEKPFRV